MKFCDLPIDTQQRLNCERLNLRNRSINNAYEVLLYNQPGTRYFHARRHQNSWYDDKGNYMPFGVMIFIFEDSLIVSYFFNE